MSRVFAVAVTFVVLSLPSSAQWLKQPTPGLPRQPNGSVDLSARAPRTNDGKPDFSGLWRRNPGRYGTDVTLDLGGDGVQPWADALMKQRQHDLVKDDPANMRCLPQGPRWNLVPFHLVKIVQTPSLIVVLSEDMSYRQIFLDGRELPRDPNPTWSGYSVGRWDGDTLVVESAGFNDRGWLDFAGHPHTEALRVVER